MRRLRVGEQSEAHLLTSSAYPLAVFPVINDLKADLNASDSAIALSISLYILAQGCLPLIWSPISEIIGRKTCFLAATAIFSLSMIVLAAATQNVAMLIAFRVIGAAGSAAMLSISAGTLADLYEPAERGVKVRVVRASCQGGDSRSHTISPGRHLLQLSARRACAWCEHRGGAGRRPLAL